MGSLQTNAAQFRGVMLYLLLYKKKSCAPVQLVTPVDAKYLLCLMKRSTHSACTTTLIMAHAESGLRCHLTCKCMRTIHQLMMGGSALHSVVVRFTCSKKRIVAICKYTVNFGGICGAIHNFLQLTIVKTHDNKILTIEYCRNPGARP